jgi:hypothetical protein
MPAERLAGGRVHRRPYRISLPAKQTLVAVLRPAMN